MKMKELSSEIIKCFCEFLDGKIEIKKFEEWVYASEELENELEQDDYLELIGFNFRQNKAYTLLSKTLTRLLQNYLYNRNIERKSIHGTCVKNISKYWQTNQEVEFSLLIGNQYDILTIDYQKDDKGNLHCTYTIIDDDGFIYLVPSDVLNVDTQQIPLDWVFDENEFGFSFEPKEFNVKFYKGTYSFWEDFHDDKEVALKEFIKVLHKLNIEVPQRFKEWAYRLLNTD